jgi:hypothetical protein
MIGTLIITIIVFCHRRGTVGVDGGGCGRVDCSRSSRIFDGGSLLLAHLLLIGVAEDDDLWANSNGVGGGVLLSLEEGLPSVEGERERLVPLLSSIGG